MAYVDGFVVPVSRRKLQAYRGMAAKAGRIWPRVMKDKRLAPMMDPKAMPFDARRMIYGGFKVMVSL